MDQGNNAFVEWLVCGQIVSLRRSVQSLDSVRNTISLAAETGFPSIALPISDAGSGGFKREKARAVIEDELANMNYPLKVTLVVYAGKKAAKE